MSAEKWQKKKARKVRKEENITNLGDTSALHKLALLTDIKHSRVDSKPCEELAIRSVALHQQLDVEESSFHLLFFSVLVVDFLSGLAEGLDSERGDNSVDVVDPVVNLDAILQPERVTL